MPLFDFECLGCGKTNELFTMAREVPRCPECGSVELKKLMGAPAPSGKSQGVIANARQRAAAAGHLSNYTKADRNTKR
jgi:putative FmdB family regulatory protein